MGESRTPAILSIIHRQNPSDSISHVLGEELPVVEEVANMDR
jgi:hypothetical protein